MRLRRTDKDKQHEEISKILGPYGFEVSNLCCWEHPKLKEVDQFDLSAADHENPFPEMLRQAYMKGVERGSKEVKNLIRNVLGFEEMKEDYDD